MFRTWTTKTTADARKSFAAASNGAEQGKQTQGQREKLSFFWGVKGQVWSTFLVCYAFSAFCLRIKFLFIFSELMIAVDLFFCSLTLRYIKVYSLSFFIVICCFDCPKWSYVVLCSVFYFATVALSGAPEMLGDAANTELPKKEIVCSSFLLRLLRLRLSELVLLCVFIYLFVCCFVFIKNYFCSCLIDNNFPLLPREKRLNGKTIY